MTYIRLKCSLCFQLGSYGPSSPGVEIQTFKYRPKLSERLLALETLERPTFIDQKMPTSRRPHSTRITRHSTSTTLTRKSKKMTNRVLRSETKHLQQSSTVIPERPKPPVDGACGWGHLPSELQKKILKLAYGRDRDTPMKPITGVDFLREKIGVVTTPHRRGKLPKLVSGNLSSFP
jgi:hypothetical protein